MLWRLISVFLAWSAVATAQPGSVPAPANLAELGQAIEQVASRTNTPGLAVALVGTGDEMWQYNVGMADLASGSPVTAETRFRVGSVAKMLVSLSVMKLVEEGRLSLDAPLSELAPEIEFHNRWEKQHPVRLVHLLNHSSGWDAPHFAELVQQGAEPISIRAALALHPHSRTSRWVPGSRSAYNNTGPLVAAYIVEKISGMPFEEYVGQHFLAPLGMEDSGYFYSDHYRSHAATLYDKGRPQPYWHLNNRAAGALNSSLEDMAKLTRFLLDRGRVGNRQLLSPASLERMETPRDTLATNGGLEVSWGLGTTSFSNNGTVFYGHEGSLPGARSMLAYQPDLGRGYVILSNSNGPAVAELHRLLSAYLARDQQPGNIESQRSPDAGDPTLAGLYRVISPVSETFGFAAQLLPWRLQVNSAGVVMAPLLGGRPRQLVPGPEGTFLQAGTGRVSLVRARDPIAGEVLHYGPQTLERTGPLAAWAPLLVLCLWSVCAVVALLKALGWLPHLLLGRGPRGASLALRAWPAMTVLVLGMALAGAVLAAGGTIPFALAGRVSVPSLLVFVGSGLFPLLAALSVWAWFRYRHAAPAEVGRFTRWHAAVLVALNLLVAMYMLAWGLAGLRLWA
ncbi:CubicO group peptidase, beta-lactamase class C family [Microbulbifer yueqingensis]|uniref:CubicO group peptidase, beta-lactamase class C family n=1 Tax=Microbulbifer yueqingensis TaxID=658219 RepID=A0A1G9D2R1_9GAMM|nr:CubicO group peptidase, beta-lactamase class C family [Microbulbifer yueqingensis]